MFRIDTSSTYSHRRLYFQVDKHKKLRKKVVCIMHINQLLFKSPKITQINYFFITQKTDTQICGYYKN